MCTKKMIALSYIGDEKITFPPKPDRQTYIQTDIIVYRVALLVKKQSYTFQHKLFVWTELYSKFSKSNHGVQIYYMSF